MPKADAILGPALLEPILLHILPSLGPRDRLESKENVDYESDFRWSFNPGSHCKLSTRS